MQKTITKFILACVMWGLGAFDIIYCGMHLGMTEWGIIGNIWIVGGLLLAWMPNKEV